MSVSTESSYPNQRRHKRYKVNRPVKLQSGEVTVLGYIRDISKGGLFFMPEVGCIKGKTYLGQELLDKFKENDALDFRSVTPDSDIYPDSYFGYVRWLGKSQAHDCLGMGIERTDALPSEWNPVAWKDRATTRARLNG